MIRIASALAGAVLALSGCATTSEPDSDRPTSPLVCNEEAGMRFTGQQATADSGHRILLATGARTLRWVPPRSAVTMDFREDRVTVSYDDNFQITRVSCG